MLLQLLEAVCTSCIGFVLKLPCFVRGIFCVTSCYRQALSCLRRGASFQSWLGLERREAFEIAAQIVRKYECAASAFHGTQCAGTNRLIKGRPTGTRDGARFSDAVGKR